MKWHLFIKNKKSQKILNKIWKDKNNSLINKNQIQNSKNLKQKVSIQKNFNKINLKDNSWRKNVKNIKTN